MIRKELLSVKRPKVQFVSWSDIEEVAVIAISGGASVFVQLMEDAWVNLCAMGDAFGQMFSCTSPMSFVCTLTGATSSASCQTMSEVFFFFLFHCWTNSLQFPLATYDASTQNWNEKRKFAITSHLNVQSFPMNRNHPYFVVFNYF